MQATSIKRPIFPKRAVVTAGMPYGNKGLHFGHIAGVFVPADIYARFLRDRIGASNVIFISGTDCYGSPIDEGYRKLRDESGFTGTIEDYVQGNHDNQKCALDSYLISLDMFEGSGLGTCKKAHADFTRDIIEQLFANGCLEKRSTAQFYDAKAGAYLNGRQVVGHCPVQGCKAEKGYADECDLGHQYMPEDLLNPKSTISGETPEMRAVTNWYFKLPEFYDILQDYASQAATQDDVRSVVPVTIREFLVPPIIYIKNEMESEYRALEDTLPAHSFIPADKGKQSFALSFACIEERDVARDLLVAKGIRLRTGKTLVPFRLTGNIEWGVPAPVLEGAEGLTVWCWPESLWAPISFTIAKLQRDDEKTTWRDWWCSKDSKVYQFIGQDNIYFYGVAQPALWAATQQGHPVQAQPAEGELQQTTLVANYHVLFLDKKASSSGTVKPPMALDLLNHYTPEQLRAHFFALGLGMKSVSFAPKPYDPTANPKAGDPVLKEGALLTNVFNRFARSCFYGAQKLAGVTVKNDKTGEQANEKQSYLPLGEVDEGLIAEAQETIVRYEHLMYTTEFHAIMALMDGYIRKASKYWNDMRTAQGEEIKQVLVNSFYLLRVCTVLMHPIAPQGTEMIRDYLGFGEDYWSWDVIFDTNEVFCSDKERADGYHPIGTLAPRVDFFEKHSSQYE